MLKEKTHIKKLLKTLKINPVKITKARESHSSEVYILELSDRKKAVLKIPYSKLKLKREINMLNLLKGKLSVPELLDIWEGDNEITGALILSYIKGTPLSDKEPISKNMAYQMGKLLGKLHENKLKDYGELTIESDNSHKKIKWWPFLKKNFELWVNECKEIMEPSFLDKCIKEFEFFFTDLPPAEPPCTVHFDFRPGNILVDKGINIKGLIDFESSRGGSPDIDFTKMKLYVWDKNKGTKEAFIDGYEEIKKSPLIDKTLQFYLFYNGFGGVAWYVRRGKKDHNFYNENMKQLQDILRFKT